ncbi:hypothetical protein [Streptomyces zagrosensis]|uniref:Chaplin domain-containing protein n=1 Tax=Streptomyces zagrosensis TaxID=1042984 RepID=A0A7W9QDP2_9ACTN|nr:hypothetical protein [Streptomyces zagrosensis]MBB5937317.1 hypothetical protein [Streptomyces zagrosensis]
MKRTRFATLLLAVIAVLVSAAAVQADDREEKPQYVIDAAKGGGGIAHNNVNILTCFQLPILPIPLLSNYQHSVDCSKSSKVAR